MAAPAVALAVKAAVAAATDKRTWKVIAVTITAVLMPFILAVLLLMSFLSGGAAHNNDAVNLAFHGGTISSDVPSEYRQHIEEMQDAFSQLDDAIAQLHIESGDGSLDSTRVKAVFYSLYFGADSLQGVDYDSFAGCFAKTETRTRTVQNPDGTHTEQSYDAAVPLTDLNQVFKNLDRLLGRTVTDDEKSNADEIHQRALGETGTGLTVSSQVPSTAGLISPVGSNWRALVTSEFGPRIDPINGKATVHTGIDLGVPTGTQVHAAKDGTVSKIAWDPDGYGNYLIIGHGGGLVTLYGHCSQIIAHAGQAVKAGDVVALSGNTGHSTGSHLHFEVRIGGKAVNPRGYLP
ncbi:M23 family metallopeptidase [Caproicibacterium lactatifermentans]|jgi:hypothetical protein|uniref:Peptidoglycan DD-metalloendopeptidase family protein n=1 Tax=Caproicibacterium lactatifermentans TaxID=2666138 RepID=A0A859DQU6_9FIRM|nr:M23 family metallopeptidase [Caproicibacterium lactatifermentans]QKN24066.1 peptidoglycan DD-metalloendopeptidase family protein [Caproicibacterium lactatifermentans]